MGAFGAMETWGPGVAFTDILTLAGLTLLGDCSSLSGSCKDCRARMAEAQVFASSVQIHFYEISVNLGFTTRIRWESKGKFGY